MQEISFREDILPLKDKLFRLALRITFDKGEAEDVVQDTMMRVWNKRDEWWKFESIEAYCITVARNLAIDRSRKKEHQNIGITTDMAMISGSGSPQDRLEHNEQLNLIYKLMDELPEKQRLVMHMRDIEGGSYKEIADALEMTEEQVKINLFRARRKVKQKYTQINEYGL